MTPRLSLSSKIVFPKNKATTKRRLKNLLDETARQALVSRQTFLMANPD